MAESFESLKQEIQDRGDYLLANPHQLSPQRFGREVLALVEQAFNFGKESGRNEILFAAGAERPVQLEFLIPDRIEEPTLDFEELKESA